MGDGQIEHDEESKFNLSASVNLAMSSAELIVAIFNDIPENYLATLATTNSRL